MPQSHSLVLNPGCQLVHPRARSPGLLRVRAQWLPVAVRPPIVRGAGDLIGAADPRVPASLLPDCVDAVRGKRGGGVPHFLRRSMWGPGNSLEIRIPRVADAWFPDLCRAKYSRLDPAISRGRCGLGPDSPEGLTGLFSAPDAPVMATNSPGSTIRSIPDNAAILRLNGGISA